MEKAVERRTKAAAAAAAEAAASDSGSGGEARSLDPIISPGNRAVTEAQSTGLLGFARSTEATKERTHRNATRSGLSLPRTEAPVDLRPKQAAAAEQAKGRTSETRIPSTGKTPAGALRWEGRAREAAAGEAGIWGGESGRGRFMGRKNAAEM